MDVSVIIAARNEEWLQKTIDSVLSAAKSLTEVIVILDGYWPETGIVDHPEIRLIHHPESIGQRAAINEGVRLSTAKYIMKLDAHCTLDEGFDVKLMSDCQHDWTCIPRMYNLHVFDWKCKKCGNQWYMGPTPIKCDKCDNTTEFERIIIWQPRWNRRSDYMRFDSDLHFQYWHEFKNRPEAKGDITDLMSNIGACFFMERSRYWELDGLDETHGSWGQVGTEISCKSWLSGGRLIINKKTWFAHFFRTQPGFSFPYSISNEAVEKARKRSKELWFGGTWPKAKHHLTWLIEKFAPVPGWTKTMSEIKPSKGIVFYTDSILEESIADKVRCNLKKCCNGHELVSVSLKELDFGKNIICKEGRGILTMFKQILAGLEACNSDIVYLCEHDVLYHPSHFEFTPSSRDIYYYNENTWKVDASTGQALFYYCKQTSGLCAYRELLIEHYRKRVQRVSETGYDRSMGFEPGTHGYPRGIDNYKAESFMSKFPNVDIRHSTNLTRSRWRQDQFRNQKNCQGWTMADNVPGWGVTRNRFKEFLQEI